MKNKRQQAAKILNDSKIDKYFGVLYVIEMSHKVGHRKFYKCMCNRCNSFTKVRSDHLLKLPKSCGNCVNTLQAERAKEKYEPLRMYKNIFNSYKSNAKSRNINFELTLDDIIEYVNSNCYYCNDNNSKGVDRIDNNKHYFNDNCVSCCKFCNIMKNSYSIEEMFERVKNIYNKHLK